VRAAREWAREWALCSTLSIAVASSACYRQVPVPLASVSKTEEVQVKITEAAAARLVKELGVYTTELEGRVARESSDSVSIAVSINRELGAAALEPGRQILFVGPGEIVVVRRREFSRRRTVLVGAGTLVGVAMAAVAVKQWGDPNTTVIEPPPPPPPSGRLEPLRVP
jgi:hypothetical protein